MSRQIHPLSPESTTGDMGDNDNQPPVLTEDEKEQRMITRITAAVIAAMKATALTNNAANPATASPAIVYTGANKQFKPEEIGFFDPELGIEDDSIITDKLW